MRRQIRPESISTYRAGPLLASWPVFIVGDGPSPLSSGLAVDDQQLAPGVGANVSSPETDNPAAATSPDWCATPAQQAFRERCSPRIASTARSAALRH